MRQRIPIPQSGNTPTAVRILRDGSALRWVCEIQDNGMTAVLQVPEMVLSAGERMLWSELGSLCGHKPEFHYFEIQAAVDDDSRAAIVDSLAASFGVTGQVAA